MNKQGKANLILIVGVIVAIGLLVYFFSAEVKIPGLPQTHGDIVNGYWDEATNECRSAPDRPNGVPYPVDSAGPTMYQCCFNQVGQQVDCNAPDTLLGPFAIYQGQTGLFTLTHAITITNTGNVALTNAWIESATWTPANANLTTAYSSIVGSGFGSALPLATAVDLTTGIIDLQAIGGIPGSPITYALSLVTKASAAGLSDSSKTTPTSMTVEQEGIQFSVDINLGA